MISRCKHGNKRQKCAQCGASRPDVVTPARDPV